MEWLQKGAKLRILLSAGVLIVAEAVAIDIRSGVLKDRRGTILNMALLARWIVLN